MGVLAPTVHWLSEILFTVLWFLSAVGSDREEGVGSGRWGTEGGGGGYR